MTAKPSAGWQPTGAQRAMQDDLLAHLAELGEVRTMHEWAALFGLHAGASHRHELLRKMSARRRALRDAGAQPAAAAQAAEAAAERREAAAERREEAAELVTADDNLDRVADLRRRLLG